MFLQRRYKFDLELVTSILLICPLIVLIVSSRCELPDKCLHQSLRVHRHKFGVGHTEGSLRSQDGADKVNVAIDDCFYQGCAFFDA